MQTPTYSEQIEASRRRIIEEALKRNGNSKTKTAWELKMDRVHLTRLVKKYGIEGTR